jgi:hypothetical protein
VLDASTASFTRHSVEPKKAYASLAEQTSMNSRWRVPISGGLAFVSSFTGNQGWRSHTEFSASNLVCIHASLDPMTDVASSTIESG